MIAATENYSEATATADFTITKANPTYTAPTGLNATYGDTLADVALPDGWAWADGTQSVGNVGTNTFKANFTPADTANYNTVSGVDVNVTVGKAAGKDAVISTDTMTYNADSIYIEGVEGQEYIIVPKGTAVTDADWNTSVKPDPERDNWVFFENLNAATEYEIYTRTAETETAYASSASEVTKITTDKSAQTAPASPEADSVTATSVTLKAIAGAEYSRDGENWQASNVFEGLSPATEYTFYARIAETATAYASPASVGTKVTTIKDSVEAPSAPTVQTVESRKIILTAVAGMEYSIDGTTWQTSNEFADLSPVTEYTFYARIAETATAYASPASKGTKATTIKDSVAAPGKPIAEKIEESSITLKEIEGAVYSLDGKTWQESNVFEGLEQGTEYTFYAKLSETETAFESEVSEGVTLTTKVLYGDANNDGKITSLDIVRLKKHLANQSVTVGKGANVNGDTVVDSLDLARLKRYFAEYDFAEKKSSVVLGPAA